MILCLNGDTYIDLDYGNLIKSTDITAAHFLSDLVVEKAKPYLLVDKKDNIIGYQSPTRGDLYFYPGIEATKPARKLNYLGVISIPTKLLSGIPYDGSFLGFFGRDDLMERLYLKSCVTVPFTDVAVNEFISIDTCEEYERILKENGYTRPILRPQA